MPVIQDDEKGYVYVCYSAVQSTGYDWSVESPGGKRESGWAKTYTGATLAARLTLARLRFQYG